MITCDDGSARTGTVVASLFTVGWSMTNDGYNRQFGTGRAMTRSGWIDDEGDRAFEGMPFESPGAGRKEIEPHRAIGQERDLRHPAGDGFSSKQLRAWSNIRVCTSRLISPCATVMQTRPGCWVHAPSAA